MRTVNEVDVQIIGKIFCPICLFIAPLGMVLIVIAPVTPSDMPSAYSYFKVTSMCVSGFWSSLWYCRTRMGWFQNLAKPSLLAGMLSGPLLLMFLIHVVHRALRLGEHIELGALVLFSLLSLFSVALPVYLYVIAKREGRGLGK